MEWYVFLIVIFAALFFVILTGLPISFSFLTISVVATYLLIGPFGVRQLILGMYDQSVNFNLTPIPFFMIMGEVFYQSGLVTRTIDTVSKFVRKVPGRLSVITLFAGGVFAALSGSAVANTAMFGSLMMPEMQQRGYNVRLTTGTIMASGALAMFVPPSALAVLLGSIAQISIAKILVGTIIPGVILLFMYVIYVLGICAVKPELAPPYDVETSSKKEMFKGLVIDILPLGFILMLVIGLIFLGIATPTESAALGALGSYILTAFYRRFSIKLVFNTLVSSLKVTSMILMIIACSAGFSQLLSISGTSRKAVIAVLGISDNPSVILAVMLTIVLIIGLVLEQTALMMITLPIFMPVVHQFGIHPVWFGVLILLCLQISQLTPPVGLVLFTMKGVSPPEVTMKDVYIGAFPFIIVNIVMLLLLIVFPSIVTFLPELRAM